MADVELTASSHDRTLRHTSRAGGVDQGAKGGWIVAGAEGCIRWCGRIWEVLEELGGVVHGFYLGMALVYLPTGSLVGGSSIRRLTFDFVSSSIEGSIRSLISLSHI
jgi:hypothetical protein